MDNSWKQDPRLKAMNKDKLAMLTEFAERITLYISPGRHEEE